MGLQGKSVLMIDDDPEFRILLRRILEGAGIETDEADSVQTGLTQLKKKVPNLVILDLSMPQVDGLAFLRYRQLKPELQHTPVLVLSGRTDKDSIREAIALGAAHYIVKPIKAADVLQKIRKIFLSADTPRFKFPEGKEPELRATIPITAERMSTNAVEILGAAKVEANERVQLHSPALAEKNLGALSLFCPNLIVEMHEGSYRQVLEIRGLTPDHEKILRDWIRKWK